MQKPHLIKHLESRHFFSAVLSHSSSCVRCCMRQGDCSCKQVNQSQTSEPDTAQMLMGVLWVCDFKQMSTTSAPRQVNWQLYLFEGSSHSNPICGLLGYLQNAIYTSEISEYIFVYTCIHYRWYICDHLPTTNCDGQCSDLALKLLASRFSYRILCVPVAATAEQQKNILLASLLKSVLGAGSQLPPPLGPPTLRSL